MRCVFLFMLALGFGAGLARPAVAQEPEETTPVGPTAGEARGSDGTSTVLFEKETLYHYIRVTENGSIRRLQFRRSGGEYEESAINIAQPLQFELRYYRLMLAAFAHQPAPKSILLVGLGGGTLPMAIHHYFPEASIDNVELDPDVAAAAKDFFGFKEDDRMKVYVRDGRVQVRRFLRAKRKYDIIFLDAFRGGYIPYHLTTKEYAEDLKELLTADGIVVSNLQPGFESYHYHRRTLAAVFPNQWSYGTRGNVVVVSSLSPNPPGKAALLATSRRLQEEKKFTVDLPEIVEEGGMRDDYERNGPILTDDYAPTDVLRSIPRD
ncbi:MAG: fused MFS/spermidine synthase [Pirellulales bacterium]|nr:fused MFS/spermidine synthase [Pirellulales bacterium]